MKRYVRIAIVVRKNELLKLNKFLYNLNLINVFDFADK